MASQFIGLHMRVVLREPAGRQLSGVVQDVEAGNSLTLVNVSTPGANERVPRIRIDASNIADLAEIKSEQGSASYSTTPVIPASAATPSPSVSQTPFVDPAILSLGRRPTPRTTASRGSESRKGRPSPQIGDPRILPAVIGKLSTNPSREQPLAPVTIVHELGNGSTVEVENGLSTSRRRKARTQTQKDKQPTTSRGGEVDGAADVLGIHAPGGHGKGWRQTPILQSTSSFQPFNALKRNGKGSNKGGLDNGWASEDVTEEMGDFDFENNLAKFDKRTIFDQMRREDQVDDEDRLVSHNRRPKPGTGGGKNLHYSENVLDLPAARNADFWNSEADVGMNGVERLSGRETRSGQSMRRGDSKTGVTRRSQSRKASGVGNGAPSAVPLSRVNSNQAHIQQHQQQQQQQQQQQLPQSSQPNQHQHQHQHQHQQQEGFYLCASNRRIDTISTLQMLNLENIAANEIGFTEDLMAENAGRGIAEVAVKALSDPAMKVRFELAVAGEKADVSLSSSTVVVLAGNNKSSIRALAAARHIRNKNINVVVCLVGIERERDLLEDLRRQILLYRNFGGKVLNKNDFFEHIRKGSATGTRVTVSLIIDALLGLTMSFEELRIGDQATVYEIMEWANRNEAFVLAVDIPTGIDPSSGKIAIIDGSRLFVKPRYVVAMGAPKRGLLEAVRPPSGSQPGVSLSAAQEDGWQLFVADIGLGSAVWRKAGTKARRGIDFDGKWVLEMRYQGADMVSDDED